ncbi:UDP-3-O-acyl-N-acetylglucosamine deacetylase [Psychrobacter sp. LV10R520-6]|uniref:UDP-3-O-acyl-N-acetylglucosamine deacetylase n=1 Tax=Psychrobacter sp. LV10R520-6 TaxID=1415574 RepID=UPI0024CBFC0E|nr:UDP-3-O-acyl-N-acetylglucosamine deacetylase [Psychrobacter sp. LV10R520-6]SNT70561.1 UDP-3-O-[3-hydroxymyristoyl] N-acetylglucosamine deacetylase [Psychrobacter sp. LV10R520-6]
MNQRTIKTAIALTGIGLHSGEPVDLEFHPQPVDTGVVFERSDINGSSPIPASAFLVQDTMMSSNLVFGGTRVGTVEHLLSAIAGLGIDNLLIRVSASEIPIMDGSASPFVGLLLQAGLCEQEGLKKFLKIVKPVRVKVDDKWAELRPYEGFELNFEIDFDHPAFDKDFQHAQLRFSTQSFIEELSSARTFGFLRDIEALRQNNLALGGSMDNAIVIDDEHILNAEGLRFADEFVRHKILDALGDLYLIGYPILGRFNAYKSGHALNNLLVREILSDQSNFEIVTFDDNVNCPIEYLSVAELTVDV